MIIFLSPKKPLFVEKKLFSPKKIFAQDLREESSFVGQRNENAVSRSWEELG